MKVIKSVGSPEEPFYFGTLAGLGAIPFSPLFPTSGVGGEVGVALRVHARIIAPVGGGSTVIRATLVADGVKPADGSGAGNTLAAKVTYNGANNDQLVVGTTAAASASATFFLNTVDTQAGALLPFPTKDISFRMSNPGVAYTGGNISIDTVELLA